MKRGAMKKKSTSRASAKGVSITRTEIATIVGRLDEIESRFDGIDTPQWICLKCGECAWSKESTACSRCGWKRPAK